MNTTTSRLSAVSIATGDVIIGNMPSTPVTRALLTAASRSIGLDDSGGGPITFTAGTTGIWPVDVTPPVDSWPLPCCWSATSRTAASCWSRALAGNIALAVDAITAPFAG